MSARKTVFTGFYSYLLTGIIYTLIMSRLPAIKAQTGLSDADVGVALMCLGGGSIVGFLTVNWLLHHLQVRTLLSYAAFCFMGVGMLLTLAQSKWQLFALFVLWGYACSYLDVAMNTHSLYIEMFTKRPYMSSMHAGYSGGCLLGSAIGAAFAFFLVPVWLNFALIALILCGIFILLRSALLPDPQSVREQDDLKENAARKRHYIPVFIFLCGLMGMFSYTAEGSVAEWGSLVLHEAKQASEGVAALAYGVFALFMASTRLFCDHLRARTGDKALLLIGTSIALCGMILVMWTHLPYVCLIGYAIMGVGLAPVFPLVLSNAGRYPGVSPKVATATVSFIGYTGLLVIPPALGFLAHHFGLERALFLPLGAILLVMLGSLCFKGRAQKGYRRKMAS